MKNKVLIKGNKYGISIVLDPNEEFDTLIEELENKLQSADTFFDSKKQIAVGFEGRALSNEEIDRILDTIETKSKLNISYIIDEDSATEEYFNSAINSFEQASMEYDNPAPQPEYAPINEPIYEDYSAYDERAGFEQAIAKPSGMFYKGTLRSGQTLETEDSVVIIGDVNPGASVIAGGNIVIIGSLKGSVRAGALGNRNCFVMALAMEPIQIQIADIIARNSDKKVKHEFKRFRQEPMIATVIDSHIYMETVSKAAIQDIII